MEGFIVSGTYDENKTQGLIALATYNENEMDEMYNWFRQYALSFKDVWTLEKIKEYYKVENDDDDSREAMYVPEFYNLNRVVTRMQRKFIEKLYKPDGIFYNKIKTDFEQRIQQL
jgi:hypothetical protein